MKPEDYGKLWVAWDYYPDLSGLRCGRFTGQNVTPENQELVAAILAVARDVRDSTGLRTFDKIPRCTAVALAEMMLAEDRLAFARSVVGDETLDRYMAKE